MKRAAHVPISSTFFVVAAICACTSREGPVLEVRPDAGPDAGTPCALECEPAGECCDATDECTADGCVPRCEEELCGSTCCESSETCSPTGCRNMGSCAGGEACAADEACDWPSGSCVWTTCRHQPSPRTWEPRVQWVWSESTTSATPAVFPLTSSGGAVARPEPPVVLLVASADGVIGRLVALDGATGEVVFTTPDDVAVCARIAPAVADLDGDGYPEIAAAVSTGAECPVAPGGAPQVHVALFDHEGTLEWESSADMQYRDGALALGDVDGDGAGDIVGGALVLRGNGTVMFSYDALISSNSVLREVAVPVLADVDGDGDVEILHASFAVDGDGTALWTGGALEGGFAVAGVFVGTGIETAAVSRESFVVLDALSGEVVRGPVTHGAGDGLAPPVAADFDGDGRPEIGVAGRSAIVVFDPAAEPGLIAWTRPVDSPSGSGGGSTAFDFDADGASELVTADDCSIGIYDGLDGALLWAAPMHRPARHLGYPVVADVDLDGNAEIVGGGSLATEVGCSGGGAPMLGITVIEDAMDEWVATTPRWTQHAHHSGVVAARGEVRVPAPGPPWHHRESRLEDPEATTLAPRFRVASLSADLTECPERLRLVVRIQNLGSRSISPGLPVAFWRVGDAMDPLGSVRLDRPLHPGRSADVSLTLETPGDVRWLAVPDDDAGGGRTHQQCSGAEPATPALAVRCR